jgi:hypothetical protein
MYPHTLEFTMFSSLVPDPKEAYTTQLLSIKDKLAHAFERDNGNIPGRRPVQWVTSG